MYSSFDMCYHISLVIAGNVKLVILLWHVRFVERVLASAVFQQGFIVSLSIFRVNHFSGFTFCSLVGGWIHEILVTCNRRSEVVPKLQNPILFKHVEKYVLLSISQSHSEVFTSPRTSLSVMFFCCCCFFQIWVGLTRRVFLLSVARWETKQQCF